MSPQKKNAATAGTKFIHASAHDVNARRKDARLADPIRAKVSLAGHIYVYTYI